VGHDWLTSVKALGPNVEKCSKCGRKFSRRPRLNVGGKAHALAVEVVIVMVIVFYLFIYSLFNEAQWLRL
jgi:hypothetical protein